MAHFAELDANNTVLQVVVVHNNEAPTEQAGVSFLHSLFGNNKTWVQTSYNNSFRKQYASVGGTYNPQLDIFIAPKPFSSWTLDNENNWQPPVPQPAGDNWYWNEELLDWSQVV